MEELIKREATIFVPDEFWKTVGSLKLKKESFLEDGRVHCNNITFEELPNATAGYSIPIEEMYETKEEAEEFLEFSNIQRTQKLKLPLWNEMQNKHYIRVEFRILDRFGEYNEICVFSYNRDHEKYNNLEITIWNEDENNEEIFNKPLTKENYDEARRICKKLFLGE